MAREAAICVSKASTKAIICSTLVTIRRCSARGGELNGELAHLAEVKAGLRVLANSAPNLGLASTGSEETNPKTSLRCVNSARIPESCVDVLSGPPKLPA